MDKSTNFMSKINNSAKILSKKSHVVIISILMSIILITVGFLYIRHEFYQIRKEKQKELQSIATLKSNQISDWITDQFDDARLIAQGNLRTDKINKWLNSRLKEDEIELQKNFLVLLQLHGYEAVLLVSPQGKLLLETGSESNDIDTFLLSKIIECKEKRIVITSDLYKCSVHGLIHFDFLAPVFNDSNVVTSVIIFRHDPEKFLFPLILNWPFESKSSETLIIRSENEQVVFLNSPKFDSNQALAIKIPLTKKDLPAIKALQGYVGLYDGIDYRGVKVMSYLCSIKGIDWAMVAKVDKSEMYQDLYQEMIFLIAFLFILILLVVFVTYSFYSSKQSETYKSLWQAQEEFKTTLYSIGDAVITTDKKGAVKYLNPVAEKLTGWIEKEANGIALEEVFNIINEESRQKVDNPVELVLKKGLIIGLANHTLLISKDKTERPIADNGAPIRDESGEIVGVVLVFRDQTEERNKQQLLIESENKYRELFETTNDGICLHELIYNNEGIPDNYRILDANKKYEEILGLKREDVINKLGTQAYGTEKAPYLDLYSKVVISGEPISFEVYFEPLQMHFYITVFSPQKNKFATVFQDITERREAEEALRTLSSRQEAILSSVPDIIMEVDNNKTYTWSNIAGFKFFGDNVIGKSADYYFEGEQDTYHLVEPLFEGNEDIVYIESWQRRKDGEKRLLAWWCKVLKNKTGQPIGALSTARDITEQKKIELAVRESEALFRTTLYSIGDAIITTNKEGLVQQLNPVAEQLIGWNESEAKNKPISEVFNIINEDTRKRVENPVEKVIKEGIIVGLANHTVLISKDGTETSIADSGAPIKDENNNITGAVLAFRNQTEERLNQKMLQIRLNLFAFSPDHTLNELCTKTLDEIGELVNSPIGFYHFLMPDQETLWLQAWSTRTEKEFCTASGKGSHYKISEAGVWVDCVLQRKPIIHNDYASLPHKKGLPEGHAPVIRELVVPVFRNDKIVAVLGVGNKPTNYTQKDLEMVGYLADVLFEVTEQKRMEELLKEREEKFHNVFEHAAVGKSITYLSGEMNVNQAFCEITGYSKEELKTLKFSDISHPDDRENDQKQIASLISKEKQTARWEKRYIHKNGNIVWVDLAAVLQRDQAGNPLYFITTIQDITLQKQLIEEIKESEAKFSVSFHESPFALSVNLLETGEFVDVNNQFLKDSDYSREEVIGHTPRELGIFLNPDELESHSEEMRNRGKVSSMPFMAKIKSGDNLECLISSCILSIHGKQYVLSSVAVISELKNTERQLIEKIEELERWYSATLGREERNIQLKKEVNSLLIKIGKPPKYQSL